MRKTLAPPMVGVAPIPLTCGREEARRHVGHHHKGGETMKIGDAGADGEAGILDFPHSIG